MLPWEAAAFLHELAVIDVRDPGEAGREPGHIAGSLLVPKGELLDAARGWNPALPLLVVSAFGERSEEARLLLVDAGFTTVYTLTGGVVAWRNLGLPACTIDHAAASGERARCPRP
jgi:rhodanese-related sulfurtransferase